MQEFQGRVAVVTGAASGIGFALAERAAREGMTVVLADVEEGALNKATESLKAQGATAIAHRLDVSRADAVEDLAEQVFSRLGGCFSPAAISAWLAEGYFPACQLAKIAGCSRSMRER